MRTHPLLCCLLTATAAAAEPIPPAPPAPPAKVAAVAPAERIPLAVLPCEAGAPELADIARAVPELLGAGLSRSKSLSLVERERLNKVLAEQSLGASGLGDPDTAARIGALIGARLLVLPRAYTVGDQLFLSAKVINTDTGQVHTVLKSGAKRQPNLSLLCNLLVEDIERVSGGSLQAPAANEDQRLAALVAEISEAIAGKPRPVVTVVVPEEHLHRTVPDPAVKTQLTYLLRKLRFKVVENDSPLLDQWVKDKFADRPAHFPAEVGNVDIVIYGGAIAETVAQTGNLVTARARVELIAIRVGGGETMSTIAKTASAADLSEHLAGKIALEKATLAGAKEFIVDLVNAAMSGQQP